MKFDRAFGILLIACLATGLPVAYTVRDEPYVFDIEQTHIDFEDFLIHLESMQLDLTWSQDWKTHTDIELDRVLVRKALTSYIKPKLVIFDRTPSDGHFNTDWDHFSELIT